MMYPSGLSIPSIGGAIIGAMLAVSLWSSNPFLAVLVGVAFCCFGIWVSMYLSTKFFENLKKNKKWQTKKS